jgi:hypothetical protein
MIDRIFGADLQHRVVYRCWKKWCARKAVISRTGLTLTILVRLAIGVHGKCQDVASAAPSSASPEQIGGLARQLYGSPVDESAPMTGQIQDLVLTHMKQWLAAQTSGPSDVDIRRELERMFAQVQYPIYAWPAVFARPWKQATVYGVGYTLGWSDYDRSNVIAVFFHDGGQAHLATVTHFVPHTDIHYAFMASSPSEEDFQFLVYGTRLGKSQRRLTAILYSFNGQTLKTLWQLQDAYDGRIRVAPDALTVRYLNENEYVRAMALHHRPPRYESVYKPTTKGMELESTREIPF